jgi:hypothetical protein
VAKWAACWPAAAARANAALHASPVATSSRGV